MLLSSVLLSYILFFIMDFKNLLTLYVKKKKNQFGM